MLNASQCYQKQIIHKLVGLGVAVLLETRRTNVTIMKSIEFFPPTRPEPQMVLTQAPHSKKDIKGVLGLIGLKCYKQEHTRE